MPEIRYKDDLRVSDRTHQAFIVKRRVPIDGDSERAKEFALEELLESIRMQVLYGVEHTHKRQGGSISYSLASKKKTGVVVLVGEVPQVVFIDGERPVVIARARLRCGV